MKETTFKPKFQIGDKVRVVSTDSTDPSTLEPGMLATVRDHHRCPWIEVHDERVAVRPVKFAGVKCAGRFVCVNERQLEAAP